MQDAYRTIQQRIEAAAQLSNRASSTVRLIAVSKRHPLAAIEQLARLGQLDFGENTLQEGQSKVVALPHLNWHFVGHLQSNKAQGVVKYFKWVHALDSLKLADRIAQAAAAENNKVNVLLQVNVAEDEAKFGFSADAVYAVVDAILNEAYTHLNLKGLMTIGRIGANATEARQVFSELRRLSEQASARFGAEHFTELSMGMSQDYEIAIEEGATLVRVGTAIFGARQ